MSTHTSRITLAETDYDFIVNTIKKFYTRGTNNAYLNEQCELDNASLEEDIKKELQWRFLNNEVKKVFPIVIT